MTKTFKKLLVKFLKVCKNIFEFIKKLFKNTHNIPQNSEFNTQEQVNRNSDEDNSPALEANIGQVVELEDNGPNILDASVEVHNEIHNAKQENLSNSSAVVAAPHKNNLISRPKINEKICSTEICSRKRKHKNVVTILKVNNYSSSSIEEIFSTNDITFNRIKDNIELLRIVLRTSSNVDEIINIYSQGSTTLQIIKSTLKISNIEPSNKNKLEQSLGILLALYEGRFISHKDINFSTMLNDQLIQSSVLACFRDKIEPVIQIIFQKECNLDYLLKGTLNYKEDEKTSSPIPSLQQICIEKLIQATNIRVC